MMIHEQPADLDRKPALLAPLTQLITIELPVGIPHRDIFRALGAIVQLGGRIVDVGDRQ